MSSSKTAPDTLQEFIHKNGVRRILARVTPGMPRFLIAACTLENIDGISTALIKVQLTAPPEEGKANKELVQELTRLLGTGITLLSGHQSRSKLLLVSSIPLSSHE